MSGGFYKRRRGILEHLEAGTIGLIDLAIHDFLSLKANLIVDPASSIPPGICFSSAVAISAICPREVTERTIRRSLAHLETLGWIKRWIPRGERGNYPILVCRASVHDLSGVEYRVSGSETLDWKNPVLIPAALSPHSGFELSGNREKRTEKREKKPTAAKPAPPADPRHAAVFRSCFEAYQARYGAKPTWNGPVVGKTLRTFLLQHGAIPVEEIARRFQNLLASTDHYHQQKHGSLVHLLGNFDAFADGPILKLSKGMHTNAKPTLDDIAAKNAAGLGFKHGPVN
jgi:hypothetical protein